MNTKNAVVKAVLVVVCENCTYHRFKDHIKKKIFIILFFIVELGWVYVVLLTNFKIMCCTSKDTNSKFPTCS